LLKKALVPAAFAACCVPLRWFAVQAARSGLGAHPVEELLSDLGYTAFVLLALTLACTPLQTVAGWNWPIRIRKLLGDFCFFYACLHMLTYVVIDQGLDFKAVATDVLKHKFIFLGMATWLLLLPLAVTSTRGWQRLRTTAFDLVLLDVQMPGMGGLEALRIMRERHPDVGVIMCSVLKDIAVAVEAMHTGALDYVTKDFSPPELIARVRKTLAQLR